MDFVTTRMARMKPAEPVRVSEAGPVGPGDPRANELYNHIWFANQLQHELVMGRDRQRSPSPRGRNYDEDRTKERDYERRRPDGSRDHRSSKNRDGRRDDEYDTSRP